MAVLLRWVKNKIKTFQARLLSITVSGESVFTSCQLEEGDIKFKTFSVFISLLKWVSDPAVKVNLQGPRSPLATEGTQQQAPAKKKAQAKRR